MQWREVRDFINKQLSDEDEIDIIHAICQGDSMDVTIGFDGALLDAPKKENKVKPYPIHLGITEPDFTVN